MLLFEVGPSPPHDRVRRPGAGIGDDPKECLSSDTFAKRAEALRAVWCSMLMEAHDPATRQAQQGLTHRWTIHPLVGGCTGETRPDLR